MQIAAHFRSGKNVKPAIRKLEAISQDQDFFRLFFRVPPQQTLRVDQCVNIWRALVKVVFLRGLGIGNHFY